MPDSNLPSPASIAAYQEFIDNLVALPGSMTYLASVAQDGGAPIGEEFSALFKNYTPEQFQLLAHFILAMRQTAFHDFLVYLHDSEYTLSHHGQSLATMPFDNPPYYDFVARDVGQSWEELGWSSTDAPEQG